MAQENEDHHGEQTSLVSRSSSLELVGMLCVQ